MFSASTDAYYINIEAQNAFTSVADQRIHSVASATS